MSLVNKINSHLFGHEIIWSKNRGVVNTKLEELETVLLCCKENLGFVWISDIIAYEKDETHYSLNYLLKHPEDGISLIVGCSFKKDIIVKSIAPLWRHAAQFEREVHEMLGVKFDFNIPRYLFPESFEGHPLQKSFKAFTTKEIRPKKVKSNFAITPKFPLNEQDIKIYLELNDDKITQCDIDMGYHHFGYEKSVEGKNSNFVLDTIGILSSRTSPMWSMAWAHLIEQGLELTIPDKAMGIRMILNELTRVKDHLYTLLIMSYQCGYEDFVSSLTIWYRKTLEQIQILTQSSNPSTLITIGGVKKDLPVGWTATCTDFLNLLEKELLTEYKFFTTNSFWFERLQCGTIDRKKAMEWGITGPALRACGVNYDLRKRDPLYFYNEVSFDIPLGVNGHIYDRFLIYVEEIFQSLKIIGQVLDNIPTGKIVSEDINSLYSHNKSLENFDQKKFKSSIYSSFSIDFKRSWSEWESSGGITHINAIFEGDRLNRLKIASPGQKLISLFSEEVSGERLEDIELFWLSLGVKMSEVEK